MRVLLVGNTGYITKEFVQEAFPESEVFIMGNSLLKTERKKHLNVRPFPERDEELEDIFHTYDFELMVYFSNYITFHGTMEGEAEKLRKVLSYCKRSKEIHVIYLTGPEAGYAAMTGKTLLVRGAENLCCQYGKMYQIPVICIPEFIRKIIFIKCLQLSVVGSRWKFRNHLISHSSF